MSDKIKTGFIDPERKEHKWYQWFDPNDTPEERKLLIKLDLLIVPYALLVWWVDYLDQTNLTNAYVSGLKTDLGFYGNELVTLQTVFAVGGLVIQLPFAYLFTKVNIHWLIPGLCFLWGIFTLLQFRVQSYGELIAYRFLIGISQGCFFPCVHYVLGSWYRGSEISRRGGLFYIGYPFGAITAGLIQSSATTHLDGINGLTGWRWMFIISSICTMPLGIVGFFIWPGTPDRPSRWWLTEDDISFAKARLYKDGHAAPKGYTLATFKRVLSSWRIYLLVAWDITFWQSLLTASGSYILWLKSLDRYSTAFINNMSTTSPAIGIVAVLLCNFGADMFRSRAGAITVTYTLHGIALLLLILWTPRVPESAIWFAQNMVFVGLAISSVLYGWANNILRHDAEERAIVLVAMNAISQSTATWIPLLILKTVEAPRFQKAFITKFIFNCLNIIFTWVVFYMSRKDEIKFAKQQQEEVSQSVSETASVEKRSGKENTTTVVEI